MNLSDTPCFIFSDESGSGRDRYWSIATVSGYMDYLDNVRAKLTDILKLCEIDYLEWKDIDGDSKCQKAGKLFLDTAIKTTTPNTYRISVLTWDRQDSRHNIIGRDDIANLDRMYYKILVNTGRKLGCDKLLFYPDENSAIKWRNIKDYIEKSWVARPKPGLIALLENSTERFEIVDLIQQDSKLEALVQLADLFAGMARYSVEKSDQLMSWMEKKNRESNLRLFDKKKKVVSFSRTEVARYQLIQTFENQCKRAKMGVSLKKRGYLWTPDPKNPINFWFYEPQHEMDKAPTRRKK